MWNYRKHLNELYEMPKAIPKPYDPIFAKTAVNEILNSVNSSKFINVTL